MSKRTSDGVLVNRLVNSERRWTITREKIVQPWLPTSDDSNRRSGFPAAISELSWVLPESSFLGSKDHLTMLALIMHMNHLPAFDYSDALPILQKQFDAGAQDSDFYAMTRTIVDGEPLSERMFARADDDESWKKRADDSNSSRFAKYAVLRDRWLGSDSRNFFRRLDFFLDPNTIVIGFWQNDYLKRIGEMEDDLKSFAQARFEAVEANRTFETLKRRFVENNEKLSARLRVRLNKSTSREEQRYVRRLMELQTEFLRTR